MKREMQIFLPQTLPLILSQHSAEQSTGLSHSQSLRKLMKSFYIYTQPYTYHRLLCSLSLTHTQTQDCVVALSVAYANFTQAVVMTTATPAFLHSFYPSIPPSSLSVKVSALLFILVFPSVSVSMCDSVCMCVQEPLRQQVQSHLMVK